MNDRMDYRSIAQNSTQVERFAAYEAQRAQAMEQAVDKRMINPADIDTKRIETIQAARVASEEAYPKWLDYVTTCGKNLGKMRGDALTGEMTRDDFDLAA